MPQKQLWRQLRGQRAVQSIPRAIFWHMSSKKETTRTRTPTAKSVKHHCQIHTEFFWEQFGNVAWWRTLGELTVVVEKNTAICDVFALNCWCWKDCSCAKFHPANEVLVLAFVPPLVSPCERSARAGFRSPPSFTLRTKCSCWLSFPRLVSPCERSARAGFRSPP